MPRGRSALRRAGAAVWRRLELWGWVAVHVWIEAWRRAGAGPRLRTAWQRLSRLGADVRQAIRLALEAVLREDQLAGARVWYPRGRTHMLAMVSGGFLTVVAAVVVLAVSAFSGPPGVQKAAQAPPASPAPTVSPPPNTILTSDFEDGTAQEWLAGAGSKLKDTTAAAHTGRHSLQVSRRANGQQGAWRNLQGSLTPESGYTLSAWVRLAGSGAPASLRLTVSWGWASAVQDNVVATVEAGGSDWARLEAQYSPVTNVDLLSVRIEPAGDPVDFLVDDFVVTRHASPPRSVPSLREVFAGRFDVGAAVNPQQLSGPEAELLKRQFGSVTPTAAMKWTVTEPAEGRFTFDDADKIVNFAVANGMQVRGHTLVWHNQTPDWVFTNADGRPMSATPPDKALLLARMTSHITALVQHYRGRITSWDVVNEVLSDDGTPRQSRWYQIAGLDYIRTAFTAAHAADPAAKLCINDVNLTQPSRRDGMYDLVAELRTEGIPVDCIGSQTHVNISVPSAAGLTASIEKFARLGVDQQITEMDMSVYTDNTSSYPAVPANLLAQQAAQYKALFAVLQRYRDQISSVTFWGIADNQTWLSTYPIARVDAPLLFGTDLAPKPAFWAVAANPS
ncbi:endo-1,4-beta-xylanase [Dactylosporangium sp. CA-139066]|uniref:endo-1,4-beta-xylanase n=1 Tax=Dactylosporangium sp. CA-139066 TaxID=3239930 RepID=UPI003D906174